MKITLLYILFSWSILLVQSYNNIHSINKNMRGYLPSLVDSSVEMSVSTVNSKNSINIIHSMIAKNSIDLNDFQSTNYLCNVATVIPSGIRSLIISPYDANLYISTECGIFVSSLPVSSLSYSLFLGCLQNGTSYDIQSLTIDTNGNLYFIQETNQVYQVNPSGTTVVSLIQNFYSLNTNQIVGGITVNSANQLYIATSNTNESSYAIYVVSGVDMVTSIYSTNITNAESLVVTDLLYHPILETFLISYYYTYNLESLGGIDQIGLGNIYNFINIITGISFDNGYNLYVSVGGVIIIGIPFDSISKQYNSAHLIPLTAISNSGNTAVDNDLNIYTANGDILNKCFLELIPIFTFPPSSSPTPLPMNMTIVSVSEPTYEPTCPPVVTEAPVIKPTHFPTHTKHPTIKPTHFPTSFHAPSPTHKPSYCTCKCYHGPAPTHFPTHTKEPHAKLTHFPTH